MSSKSIEGEVLISSDSIWQGPDCLVAVTYKGGELVVEALNMIVGSKEVVEYSKSISHILLVYGVERVGVPSSNPCSLKVGDKCIKFIRHRKLLRNLIPGRRNILSRNKG